MLLDSGVMSGGQRCDQAVQVDLQPSQHLNFDLQQRYSVHNDLPVGLPAAPMGAENEEHHHQRNDTSNSGAEAAGRSASASDGDESMETIAEASEWSSDSTGEAVEAAPMGTTVRPAGWQTVGRTDR